MRESITRCLYVTDSLFFFGVGQQGGGGWSVRRVKQCRQQLFFNFYFILFSIGSIDSSSSNLTPGKLSECHHLKQLYSNWNYRRFWYSSTENLCLCIPSFIRHSSNINILRFMSIIRLIKTSDHSFPRQ